MSKQNNLTDFLTDVANAIRAKKGSTDLINPQNFSSEIASLSGGLEIVDMTETTATIAPNKVYVWGMVESLNITLGASTDENDFFAFRFRCSKPTMTSLTVNGATWAEDTELDTQGKPVLDLGSYYQCEIKGGTSALYARLMHYIPFEDSNVEAVLLSKGVGDGLGITYKDAARVTTLSTWFKNNTDIVKFNELYYFGITTGQDIFSGCSNLKNVTLPKSRSEVPASCFAFCSSLTSVNNLTENDYLTQVAPRAFYQCSAITSVVLPKNVTIIKMSAFQGCSLLESAELPAALSTVGQYAFKQCTKLKKISNLENTAIVSFADEFCSYSGLTEITFPSGLQDTGFGVSKNCYSLVKAILGSEITTVQESAFQNCSSLKTLVIKAVAPPTLVNTNAIPPKIEAIYVPDESISAYQGAANWSSFASKIKGISEMPA